MAFCGRVRPTTARANSPAGDYPITAADAADPNYAITYVAGTLTVTSSGAVEIRILNVAPTGEATLQLVSDPNRKVTIQWTADFVSWTDLVTLENVTGTIDHIDATAVGVPYRFYRAVLTLE